MYNDLRLAGCVAMVTWRCTLSHLLIYTSVVALHLSINSTVFFYCVMSDSVSMLRCFFVWSAISLGTAVICPVSPCNQLYNICTCALTTVDRAIIFSYGFIRFIWGWFQWRRLRPKFEGDGIGEKFFCCPLQIMKFGGDGRGLTVSWNYQ